MNLRKTQTDTIWNRAEKGTELTLKKLGLAQRKKFQKKSFSYQTFICRKISDELQ